MTNTLNLEPIINALPCAQVCPKLLSDGSLVYDVQIIDGDSLIEVNALDERRAREAAESINAAIREAIGNYI